MSKGPNKSRFIFESFNLDKGAKTAEFTYRISNAGEDFVFTETLQFPKDKEWRDVSDDVLNQALLAIHLSLGTSYWKTSCPSEIGVESGVLNKNQAEFWDILYTRGMGEFFYKNKIDFRNLVNFPVVPSVSLQATSSKLQASKDRSLLLFGGGKDSLVSAELLKKAQKPFTFFFVASGSVADVVSKLLPKDSIVVHRQIDLKLFELNKRPDVFNGHIPITAIIIFIAELAALLYDYDNVIASNERSSSYGNVEYLGQEINHQWSKSLEAEKMIQDYSRAHITPSVNFFSLLRPFYEIKILEIFSHYPEYFDKFSSCNKNFKAVTENRIIGWCGHCPKCAFVFLMMTPFIPKKKLVGIFGKNLLDDASLTPLFKELLGLENFKPFECVGTIEESRYAISKVAEGSEYVNDSVIQALLAGVNPPRFMLWRAKKDLFKTHKDHLIPKEFIKVIK